MRKVEWGNAPTWANFCTVDRYGPRWWSHEPFWNEEYEIFQWVRGYDESTSEAVIDKYIEKRPTEGDIE